MHEAIICAIKSDYSSLSFESLNDIIHNISDKYLKPCPFCGSFDIKLSRKKSGHFKQQYQVSMYCDNCHCYGPRVLSDSFDHIDYENSSKAYNDNEVKEKAIELWNKR